MHYCEASCDPIDKEAIGSLAVIHCPMPYLSIVYLYYLNNRSNENSFQIRDYRKHVSNQVPASSAQLGLPIVNKVRLRMTFENVVKDITLLSDDSWSYRDFVVSIVVVTFC